MNPDNIIVVRPHKTVYRDGNEIIKLFNEGFSIADVLNEAHNHAIVEETGFTIPRLERVTKIDGKWAIVTQCIAGKTLAQCIEEDPANAENYLERMVDIQLVMHTYSSTKLRRLTDKMHERIDKSDLDNDIQYELHTRLESMPRHSKLCHGDMNPGNVIIDDSGIAYVIDWAHATQGNASADAARTYLLFRIANDENSAEKYLNLFCKKSNTDRNYVQKWLSIVAASHLLKCQPNERDFLSRWANVVQY